MLYQKLVQRIQSYFNKEKSKSNCHKYVNCWITDQRIDIEIDESIFGKTIHLEFLTEKQFVNERISPIGIIEIIYNDINEFSNDNYFDSQIWLRRYMHYTKGIGYESIKQPLFEQCRNKCELCLQDFITKQGTEIL